MNTRSKFALLCLGASLAVLPSMRADDTPPPPPNTAPGGGGPEGGWKDREKMREHMQEKIIKDLNLTADQQTKWKALDQQEHDAVKALREDTSLPREQKRPKMEEIRKNFEGQRRAILTPDQQTKFDELRAKMKDRMRDHRGGQGQDGPPPPPPDNK